MVNHLACSVKLLMNSDVIVKQDHQHALDVHTDLPHCLDMKRGKFSTKRTAVWFLGHYTIPRFSVVFVI